MWNAEQLGLSAADWNRQYAHFPAEMIGADIRGPATVELRTPALQLRLVIATVWEGEALRLRRVLCLAVSLCAAGPFFTVEAQAPSEPLLFPGDQFNDIGYQPRQSIGDPVYESVLTDLREANFEPLAYYPPDDPMRRMARPVGLLKVLLDSNQYLTCTASIIDRDLVLTNWHCLPRYGDRVRAAALEMDYYSAANADDVRRYAVKTRAIEASENLDYAILKVEADVSEWGRINLASSVPPANYSLRIVHHPAGRPKQITQKSCRAFDPPISRRRLRHKCDTLPGSSGSPVFLGYGEDARVVALHHAGVPARLMGIDPSLEANSAIPVAELLEVSPVIKRLVTSASGDQASSNVLNSASAISGSDATTGLQTGSGASPELLGTTDGVTRSSRDQAMAELNELLGKSEAVEIKFPETGVVRLDGATFTITSENGGPVRRSLAVGAGVQLLGYSNDRLSYIARHADFGEGAISVAAVAVQH